MKFREERFFIIISLKIKLSNLFSIQHPGKRVLSWETIAECFVMVRIKSIHNIGYKTAFYMSLYLLLSDSIQNILITFWPENAYLVSFKCQILANSQYVKTSRQSSVKALASAAAAVAPASHCNVKFGKTAGDFNCDIFARKSWVLAR